MARNLPGPYAVEILYSVTLRPHAALFNCITIGAPAPGSTAASVSLATKAAGSILIQTAVDQLWNILRLSMSSGSTNVIGWTLWRYNGSADDKTFITAGPVTAPTGAIAAAVVPASYSIVSMRSGAGSTLKVTMLDTVYTQQSQLGIVPNAAATSMPEKLAAYLLSGSNWIIARDDSYPVAPLRQSFGQNETVWKKINRP